METSPPYKKFTDQDNVITFCQRQRSLYTTRVYLFRPPKSLSTSDRPWIVTRETTSSHFFIFRHPLTSKPYSFNIPPVFYFSQLKAPTLSTYFAFSRCYSFDKLLTVPTQVRAKRCTMFVLYGGGLLKGCPRFNKVEPTNPWVNLPHHRTLEFDDIIDFRDKVYAVDRHGITRLINYHNTINTVGIGKTLIFEPLTPGSGRFGWRKRFAVDEGTLYLVLRKEEKLFQVFRLKRGVRRQVKDCFYWDRVEGFKGKKVLFMARDCYFFRRASRKFPGREYKNCIVFSEAAFPQYGNNCWEFTQSGDRQFCEDDIAVFRLDDERFVREGEGEKSGFPKIDSSPPDWIFNVSSFTENEFSMHSVSESSDQSERKPDEDEELDADSGGENDGEVQSDLKNSKNKDDEEEVMEHDFGSQDQEDQCELNSQQKDNEEMPSKETNIEGDNASLQKVPGMPSQSAVEEEVTRTRLGLNSGNDAMEEETSGKNITQEIPKASTSSGTKSHTSDTATTKFEGLDIRSDLVPTLKKIWQKHGNIIKDSIVRSGDIVARALESLATMVQMLEDNPAQSLSDSQADYLSSTLSDLRSICFKVCWLVSFVEKALKIHKSKPLVESLSNLSQLSSKVKERRAILLGELANLNEEENKLMEEMTKVSKMIPFSGQVKFDEPIGAGFS